MIPAWAINAVMPLQDDLTVGALFHAAMKLRESLYQREVYAPRLASLRAAKEEVPGYLELAALETRTEGIETTTFAMSCFWEGESRLGALDGVTGTRAGWMEGREVVELKFDPKRMSYEQLLLQARKMNCLSHAFVSTEAQRKTAAEALGASNATLARGSAKDAKASDQLYYLKKSPLAKLALSPLQKTRINADLRVGRDAKRWLSPRQRASLAE